MAVSSDLTREDVVALHRLLDAWNARSAESFSGMVPPGESELKVEAQRDQSLVAVVDGGAPRIALFQNTPAPLDDRPELADRLTAELTNVLRSGRVVDAG